MRRSRRARGRVQRLAPPGRCRSRARASAPRARAAPEPEPEEAEPPPRRARRGPGPGRHRQGLRIREGPLRHLHRRRAEGARRGVAADDRHRLLHPRTARRPDLLRQGLLPRPRQARRARPIQPAASGDAAQRALRARQVGLAREGVRRPDPPGRQAVWCCSSCSTPRRCAASTTSASSSRRSGESRARSSRSSLIEQIADDGYDPRQFVDEEKARILAAVERKIAGSKVVAPSGGADAGAPGHRPDRRLACQPRGARADGGTPCHERARRRARAQARAPRREGAGCDRATDQARARSTIGPMTDLSAFPITRKWPARHPDRLQLYSLPTPNGVKVSILLEETGLPYEPHLVAFDRERPDVARVPVAQPEQQDPGDPRSGRPGRRAAGAVRVGRDPALPGREDRPASCPRIAAGRYETIQWLMFQMGGIGPMFGQLGFFHKFAGKDYEDKRPRDRYVGRGEAPARRARRAGWPAAPGSWATTYTIADIAIFPWVRNLVGFYGAGELVGFDEFPQRRARARGVRRAAGGAGRSVDSKTRHPLNRAGLLRPSPTESRRQPRYGGAQRHHGPMP